jgi:hypothetical protein
MRSGSRGALAAVVFVTAFAASGCELLAGAVPGGLGSFPVPPIGGTSGGGVAGEAGEPGPDSSQSPDVGDGAPPAIATYRSGRATVVLSDGTQVVLDRINRGPHLYAQFGSLVRWSNDSGWYLTIAGAGAEPDMGPAYLTIDRLTGTQHWTANDPLSCNVRAAAATPSALSGTAACRGVRWTDALEASINGEHPRIEGQPPFSATVTFEAAP